MPSFSNGRALAKRLATILVEKAKPDEAVAILSTWAACGPNDADGQALLAEALRLDPASRIAKMAFERMEGLAGDHAHLDALIAHYTVETLEKLERQYRRPTFHRAQVGFNNNVKYKGAVFHVQTEDSGVERPHVITHLFADGGRIIKSHKRTYEQELNREDLALYVRQLMKAQHMEMCVALREGSFDEIIAGRANAGGVRLLEGFPEVRIRRGSGEKRASSPELQVPKAPAPVVRARLRAMRSLWGGQELYEALGDEVVIGRRGDVALDGEVLSAEREAVLRYRDGKLWLASVERGNGVFVRVRHPVELDFDDEVLVGDQVLKLRPNPETDDWPDPGPTYFYSSPRWPSSFQLVQIWQGGLPGAVLVARGSTAQIGAAIGDMLFADDPLVDDQHCVIEEQAGSFVLTDLGSRAGTFVRVVGEREVIDGDEIVIGRTRLRIELA